MKEPMLPFFQAFFKEAMHFPKRSGSDETLV